MLQLMQAYERYARRREWQINSRFVLRQYRPEFDRESSMFDEAKYNKKHRPDFRLSAILDVDDSPADGTPDGSSPEPPPLAKVLDVFRVDKFHQPDAGVIGLALVARGESAYSLLEREYGLHEFIDRSGQPETCVVETHPGRLLKYSPPMDVCRRSFLTRGTRRRRYQLNNNVVEDALLKSNLKVDDGSLPKAVAAAVDAYFASQLEKLLAE
jgi:hypothetical protein